MRIDMRYIKRLNEMNENQAKDTLKDIMLGYVNDMDDYQVTFEGFLAIYYTLYKYTDKWESMIDYVKGFVKWSGVVGQQMEYDMWDYLKQTLVDAIFDGATTNDVINSIESGDFYNFLDSRDYMFENMQNDDNQKWAEDVRAYLERK